MVRSRVAIAALAALAAAPTSARAQQGAAAAPGPAAGAQDHTPEATEAARRLFGEGVQLANGGRWEEARDRFRRALAVRPSPLLRYNLAVAAQNSGHFVEAIDQYRQFLRDDSDPANAIRRQEAQTAINAMEPVLAHLVVGVRGDEAAQVRLDGRALPTALLGVDVPVDPGEHIVEAEGARGGAARATVALGEGARRTVVLALDPPAPGAHGDAGADAAPRPPRPPPAAVREVAAPQGTIERVRRAIEARAAVADADGQRRWHRTMVFFAFTGSGDPVGFLGLGMRWAARPWFEFEIRSGGFHPFGPGVGFFFAGRVPLSYRYTVGLSLGVSTNFTRIPQGQAWLPGQNCEAESPFTPLWLMAAITHEWRVSIGFTYRLSLGARYLANNTELDLARRSHCVQAQTTVDLSRLIADGPEFDHGVLPVMPWVTFDLGYSM